MARLKSHGSEVMRTEVEYDVTPEQNYSVEWERVQLAYMSDGNILQKTDVRFRGHQSYESGFYSYGWKLYKRLKPGISMTDHAAKIRKIIEAGESKWHIVTDSLPPVLLDQSRVLQAVEADNLMGFCKACGAEQSPIEPDAHGVRCESCGRHEVYGAEELLFQGNIWN